MDPYLENAKRWRDVHQELITSIRGALAPQVAPNYYVAVEEDVYLLPADPEIPFIRPDAIVIASPTPREPTGGGGVATAVRTGAQMVTVPYDDSVREGFLEIRETGTNEVCTVIELLSPTNKLTGEGRRQYESKRNAIFSRWTNLIEIDLLRDGEPMPMEPLPHSDYRILVRRSWEGSQAHLWTFGIRHSIPEVPVPLREREKEASLALGSILAEAYDRARYDLRIDYRQPPPDPPLSEEDAAWLDELLKAAGRRP